MDTIGKILDECSVDPELYLVMNGCEGTEASACAAMCTHLVGRTVAAMREGHIDGQLTLGGTAFRVGDHVISMMGESGEVAGFAKGRDGQALLVLRVGAKAVLCRPDEVRLKRVPTEDEVRDSLKSLVQEAASGNVKPKDYGTYVDTLIAMMRAHYDGRPF